MVGQGGRNFDVIRQISSNVLNVFNKKQGLVIGPCDGWILRMHYQWTFWIFMGGFSAIWYSWFHRDVIQCVSHFSAENNVRLDYLNICLSYPFLNLEDDKKRYLLFYRWTHWVFLILAMVYYIPRKISKISDNPKLRKLFEDLAANQHRYDEVERNSMERAARYLVFNYKTHDGLYYKYLFCNLIALGIDIACFHSLDFVFQGKFMKYGYNAFPFYRDPRHFTDTMSQTFPPFAKCTLHKKVQLVDDRTEQFGCHLTVMELYEKLFLFVWFWLLILIGLTVLYIIYLLFLWISFMRLHVLRVAKPVSATSTVRFTVCSVISNCKIGDVYLLYRLRQFFSHARYYELLVKITDQDFKQLVLEGVRIDLPSNRNNQHDNNIKQRRPNGTQQQSNNQRRFLNNSDACE